jgi:FMN reductase
VFAASEDFGGGGAGTSLAGRADRAGRELADLALRRPSTGPVDPFENPTPFEQLLGNNG